jgi:hypothetical protein
MSSRPSLRTVLPLTVVMAFAVYALDLFKLLPRSAMGASETADTAVKGREAMNIGVEAVIYGLPIVMMDLTMKRMTNVSRTGGIAAPVNQFAHAPIFPPATFRNVVRANVDTLYSSAFLDLTSEPLVLTVPDTGGRYYLLPMFDGPGGGNGISRCRDGRPKSA